MKTLITAALLTLTTTTAVASEPLITWERHFTIEGSVCNREAVAARAAYVYVESGQHPALSIMGNYEQQDHGWEIFRLKTQIFTVQLPASESIAAGEAYEACVWLELELKD